MKNKKKLTEGQISVLRRRAGKTRAEEKQPKYNLVSRKYRPRFNQ